MEIREIRPAEDEPVARSLLRVQRAGYAVEAALIGDDRIPALGETLAELRAAPLTWLGALVDEPTSPDQATAGGLTIDEPAVGGLAVDEPPVGGGSGVAGGRATAGLSAGGRLVGAVAWTEDASTVDINRLVVDPVAHRRGVGRALLGEVLNRAGGRTVLVATGRANRPARALYESYGFVALGDAEPVPGLWIARYARSGPAVSAAAIRRA